MNKKEFDFLKEILLKADGLYENDRGNLEIDIESINIKLTPVELLKMVQIDFEFMHTETLKSKTLTKCCVIKVNRNKIEFNRLILSAFIDSLETK